MSAVMLLYHKRCCLLLRCCTAAVLLYRCVLLQALTNVIGVLLLSGGVAAM
jgi:hypothetical protein